MSVQALKRLFTTEDYHRMMDNGILSENDLVELLGGEIVEMSPIGSRHAACVNRLTEFLASRLVKRGVVSVQNPIHLSAQSEPQPDVAVLRMRSDYYAESHAEPQDVLLIVEVAETSIGLDRDVKLPLYAEANIPEVWLVDLGEECVRTYSKPSPHGYSEIRQLWRDDVVSPQAFPDLKILVTDILG